MPMRNIIEGRPLLIVVDIQGGAPADDQPSALPFMPGYGAAMDRAPAVVEVYETRIDDVLGALGVSPRALHDDLPVARTR